METAGDHVRGVLAPVPGKTDETLITVSATEPGVRPYLLSLRAADKPLAEFKGTLLAAKWQATFFHWPTNMDPRKDLEGYRKLAEGSTAVSEQLEQLSLKYGMRSPSDTGISPKITAAKLGQRHFGMIARTRLPLTKGTWAFTTLSDDGVRVVSPLSDFLWRWPAIQKLSVTRSHVFAHTAGVGAIIIPRRAFADEAEFEAFVNYMATHARVQVERTR